MSISLSKADLSQDFSLITLSGTDRFSYLNALFTNAIIPLPLKCGQRNLLLDNKGKIIASLWLWKKETNVLLLVATSLKEAFLNTIEKYRFNEAIAIHPLKESKVLLLQGTPQTIGLHFQLPQNIEKKLQLLDPLQLLELYSSGEKNDDSAFLVKLPLSLHSTSFKKNLIEAKNTFLLLITKRNGLKTESAIEKIPLFEKKDVETWHANRLETGELFAGLDYLEKTPALFLPPIVRKNFIALGVGKNKGCFPGQEILAKAQSKSQIGGRSFQALTFPKNIPCKNFQHFKVVDDKNTIFGTIQKNFFSPLHDCCIAIATLPAKLPKNLWISNATPTASLPTLQKNQSLIKCASILTLPLKIPLSKLQLEKIEQMHTLGLEYFHKNNLLQAQKQFEAALKISSNHILSIEALGVIYEKQNKLFLALKMHQLWSEIDPNAVMARTNLSRIYMQLGFIEKAETEKQKATLLQFKQSAKEAQQEKVETTFLAKQKEEMVKKRQLFERVLALDPKDVLALFGLGKICYETSAYTDALTYLQKTIQEKKNYSLAYLFAGKTLLQLNKKETARKKFEEGIIVAKQQKEMMPLKAMEAELANL